MNKPIVKEFAKASEAVMFLNKVRRTTDEQAIIDIKHINDEPIYQIIYQDK